MCDILSYAEESCKASSTGVTLSRINLTANSAKLSYVAAWPIWDAFLGLSNSWLPDTAHIHVQRRLSTECSLGVACEAQELWADMYERLIRAQCICQAEGMPQAQQWREEGGWQGSSGTRSFGLCTGKYLHQEVHPDRHTIAGLPCHHQLGSKQGPQTRWLTGMKGKHGHGNALAMVQVLDINCRCACC